MNATANRRQDNLNAAYRHGIQVAQGMAAREAAKPAAARMSDARFAQIVKSSVSLNLQAHYQYAELWDGTETVMNGLRRTGRVK